VDNIWLEPEGATNAEAASEEDQPQGVGSNSPYRTTIGQLFEEQVSRTPLKIAVASATDSLTYTELNRRANQLARLLRNHGVGPEVLVALCMERSIEMIVGIIAVLKAGGAYVPLDPAYPVQRIELILRDTASPVVLTQSHLRTRLPEEMTLIISIDREWPPISEQIDDNLAPTASYANSAYVIYTSGSTGKPKGVQVSHSGLINYVLWSIETYLPGSPQPVLMHSPLGFDLTVTSIFPPLLSGSSIWVVREGHELEDLVHALRARRDVALIKLTPSHLDALTVALKADPAVRCETALIVGGEALRYEQVESWRRLRPGSRIINEYGPTETIVGCSIYEISDLDPSIGSVPIGKPITNAQIYLLDSSMEQVATELPGELYIGGSGLARGYLRQPDLTAERFVPNPFGQPGDRIYRTGDVGRRRKDGELEFLGRLDDQIKIRGYRIEPGEIEGVLREQPEIDHAHVIAKTDKNGVPKLVAYIVGRDLPTSSQLRMRLQTRLPDYMLPAEYISLDSVPLTAHGKLDRGALTAVHDKQLPN
jgi:amino acid adenylation domain-containing protein